ncbi:MAG: hypothetical protein II096_00445 [Erysipelotrichaceae bacterium]|nr:hypothetical protein [Erysipelotrichaceae bacterium]
MSELKDFKCPNCGGRLEFDAQTQKLKCPYCDGTFDPEVFNEGDNYTVSSEKWEDDDIVVYTCKSCGGTIMADRDTAASSCPYCGNPVVMASNVSGIYKPKKVIPFLLDKKQAKERYKNFLKGKVLLPDAFKNEAVIDEMKGIYVPYWLFGGKANARMWFDATRVRHWNEGEYMCTETSYYKVFRSGSVRFADVPVDASGKIDDLLTESIEPFDIKEAKEFSENYLAGYYADKYSVSAEESRQKANSRIANSTASLFASTTRMYDSCAPSSSSISISDGRQDYVMYPVWLLNIKYGSKLYTFAMNGQTGKFVGELPIDRGKLGRIAISVFLGVTAAMTALQYLLYLVR